MLLPSQFSLSLDLSHPINGLAKIAGRSALDVIRHFHDSGSNIFIENSLASVLGGNMIEPSAESAFRMAISFPEKKHILSKALDLVVEGGAGPTSRCALLSETHFRSLIQLSLLAWTHSPAELSVALSRAVEKYAEHAISPVPPNILDASDLKGTLKACRDQTVLFPWNHYFRAVEAKLGIDIVDLEDKFLLPDHRSLSYTLLEALLFMLPKVQRAPEEYRLVIQTSQALSLIVVWAHHILGLDVKVVTKEMVHHFGRERDCVVVEYNQKDNRTTCPLQESTASLYTVNSGEIQFKIESSDGIDVYLEPGLWQCLEGYGAALFGRDFDHDNTIGHIGEFVVALSIAVVHDKRERFEEEKRSFGIDSMTPDKELPPNRKILEVGSILFDHTLEMAVVKGMSQQLYNITKKDSLIVHLEEVLKRLDVKLYQTEEETLSVQKQSNSSGAKQLLPNKIAFLSHLVLVFCNVANIDHCRNVPLNLETGIRSQCWDVSVPPASESFNIIAQMMNGSELTREELPELVALSSCGWTLYLASISLKSPANVSRDIFLMPGVLARSGIRKDYIKDGLLGPTQTWQNSSEKYDNGPMSKGKTIATGPDTLVEPECYAREVYPARGLVTSSKLFYGVLYEFGCYFQDCAPDKPLKVTLGYRRMQEIAWTFKQTPDCAHGSKYPGKAMLPEKAITFTGWKLPVEIPSPLSGLPQQASDTELCISLISGHRSARWIFLYLSSRRRPIFLKSDNCCFQCAVDYTMGQVPGKLKVLVL